MTVALEACGVRYTVGGSLASSFSGEPRGSIDVDVIVDIRLDQVRDALSILMVQGRRLDEEYVSATAMEVGLVDLLERARREATADGNL